VTHELAQQYQRLASVSDDANEWTAWLSPSVADPLWDAFLSGSPYGQFQQSSMWAEYKAAEGWNHHRVVLMRASGIVGGFQILWKPARFGRVGYVSKGPVAAPETSLRVQQLGKLLFEAVKELGLSSLIVQQPDETRIALRPPDLGLVPGNPTGVYEATYLVDLRPDLEVVRARMKAKLRQNIRKARKRGTNVREGTQADLPTFFDLMVASCRRLQTVPNPPSLEAVRRLWRIFSAAGAIRVTVAECDGAVRAAELYLAFGDLVTAWKKGWDGSHGDWHPNELIEDEAIEWAQAKGFRAIDFSSFNPEAARRLLDGESVPVAELTSRDAYHVRFGGTPKLLPQSMLMVPNPVLRWSYRNLYRPLERRRSRHAVDADLHDRA
jgi:hypothetical protein